MEMSGRKGELTEEGALWLKREIKRRIMKNKGKEMFSAERWYKGKS